MTGRPIVGHGLHQSRVTAEGSLDQVLPIAGDGAAADGQVPCPTVDGFELVQHHGHRVAPVGAVVGVQQVARLVDQGQLGGGGTGVDAQICPSGIARQVPDGDVLGVVPGQKLVIVRLGFKQRGQGICQAPAVHRLLQAIVKLGKGDRFVALGAQSCANGGIAVAIVREDGMIVVQTQGLLEPQAQLA